MKFDMKTCAGIGGAAGIILGLLLAMTKYDFSQVDQMQQAVGSILVDFIVGAVVGWLIGMSTRRKT